LVNRLPICQRCQERPGPNTVNPSDKISALSPDRRVRRSPGKQSCNDEAERAAEPLAFRDIHVRPPMFARALRCDGYKYKQSLYSAKYD
jgi:hypothetical protein